MSELVQRLANLTAIRDRDALDIALVTAINDMLLPLTTCISRVVGEKGDERWLISAQLKEGQTVPTADPAWAPVDLLPVVGKHPLRQQAVATQQVQQATTAPFITVFPLASTVDSIGILEVQNYRSLVF